ncbi:hypothetical protein G7B40_041180 [Aetokthonos hydrillicola Thurmond2011]|jgi:hypothetical protein|uniref:Uncharacterized protein n=1 Tax=Aetokthonos hydrillicola Thurmond2011 TaxID=2712845 RepID=A0AAP5IFZ1_9CYAN|nr:hypothetical protein [Aetokthonos hydrillicola]MBW4591132.1 hypothetical protein [Aetokthonos hydrillicola CCALA 1050]MDR9900901.1 hypothetical protein [Aetokthonos hydrillicola Thurmond2011]
MESQQTQRSPTSEHLNHQLSTQNLPSSEFTIKPDGSLTYKGDIDPESLRQLLDTSQWLKQLDSRREKHPGSDAIYPVFYSLVMVAFIFMGWISLRWLGSQFQPVTVTPTTYINSISQ